MTYDTTPAVGWNTVLIGGRFGPDINGTGLVDGFLLARSTPFCLAQAIHLFFFVFLSSQGRRTGRRKRFVLFHS